MKTFYLVFLLLTSGVCDDDDDDDVKYISKRNSGRITALDISCHFAIKPSFFLLCSLLASCYYSLFHWKLLSFMVITNW